MIRRRVSSKKKVVCILGTGKSGTSMITRVINLMGIYLGKSEDIKVPNKDVNTQGYWENIKITKIHDEILKEFNSSLESTRPLPNEWWKLPKIEKYKIRLMELIKNELDEQVLWGFKDPRLCVMLPLWERLFYILDIDPMFVIPIRNPIDVANSLMKSDGLGFNYGLCLWYYHMVNIIDGTKGYNRIFIKYDDMVENPDSNLNNLGNFLSMSLSEEDVEKSKKGINPDLRNNISSEEKLKDIDSNNILELYNICMKLVEDPDSEVDSNLHSSEVYKSFVALMDENYSDKKYETYYTSLYADYGHGYSEEAAVNSKFTINENGEFNITFELGQGIEEIKSLKWYPLEGQFCKFIIGSILINGESVKIQDSNADYFNEKEFNFINLKPMFILENCNNKVETVNIIGQVTFYELNQLQEFFEKEKLKNRDINESLTRVNEDLNKSNEELNRANEELNNLNNQLAVVREELNRTIAENENNRVEREKEIVEIIRDLENRYINSKNNKIKDSNKIKNEEEKEQEQEQETKLGPKSNDEDTYNEEDDEDSESGKVTKILKPIKRLFFYD